jgi:drug/metabolite transporter (DMT)-like permease
MTGAAVLLVLVSALAHAGWNFLAKRAGRPEVFTWWMAATANVLLLPLALAVLVVDSPEPRGWLFVAGTWCVHLIYFLALGRGYRDADLSLVYPFARGTGILLVPVAGVVLLGESVSLGAGLGIALVLAGVLRVGFAGQDGGLASALRSRGLAYALLTGLAITAYSTIDARGVQYVNPLLYMYLLTTSATIGLRPIIARDHPQEAFTNEWRINRWEIVIGGLLQFAAYALVLAALRLSPVSYVAPFREVALVAGVILGIVVLREPGARPRLLGAAIISAGAITIALAP